MSDHDTKVIKVVGSTIACLTSLVVIAKLIHRQVKKNKTMTTPKPVAKPASGNARAKAYEEDLRKWYKDALDKIVTARLEQESSVAYGEPVFLSHYIHNGQFRHWVMHVHGYKYELRANDVNASADIGGGISGSGLGGGTGGDDSPNPYRAAVAESRFDMEEYKRSVALRRDPRIGPYFYSMIGWTDMTREQVDRECASVWGGFGAYGLLANNCHDFLQRLAERIVTRRAPDWQWFRFNVLSGYEYMNRPHLDRSTVAAAAWIKLLRQRKHYLTAEEQREVDAFIAQLDELVELSVIATMNNAALIIGQASQPDNGSGAQGDGRGGGGHHDGGGATHGDGGGGGAAICDGGGGGGAS